MKIANLYIDGFNFYYAIKNKNKTKKRIHISNAWCDFRRLAENELLPPDTQLGRIKYFTARVENLGRGREWERQAIWLRAVQTIPGLDPIFGVFVPGDAKYREEKQTDVNIAVQMLVDGYTDAYDYAVLITGDIDLAPAAIAIAHHLKRSVDIWIPPGQPHSRWDSVAAEHGISCRELKPFMLARSRLKDRLEVGGDVIECLPEWRVPQRKGGV